MRSTSPVGFLLLSLAAFFATSSVAQEGAICPSPSPQSLQTCTWYDDSTCCTPGQGIDAIASLIAAYRNNQQITDECGQDAVPEGCIDQLTLFICFGCSPKVDSYISASPLGFRVCEKFADKIYNACKSFKTPTANGCKAISEQYSNGREFLGSVLADEDDDEPEFSLIIAKDNCFNAAEGLAPLGLLAFFAAAALLL